MVQKNCNRCPKDESDSSAQKQGKKKKRSNRKKPEKRPRDDYGLKGMKKKIKIILDKSLSRDVRRWSMFFKIGVSNVTLREILLQSHLLASESLIKFLPVYPQDDWGL